MAKDYRKGTDVLDKSMKEYLKCVYTDKGFLPKDTLVAAFNSINGPNQCIVYKEDIVQGKEGKKTEPRGLEGFIKINVLDMVNSTAYVEMRNASNGSYLQTLVPLNDVEFKVV